MWRGTQSSIWLRVSPFPIVIQDMFLVVRTCVCAALLLWKDWKQPTSRQDCGLAINISIPCNELKTAKKLFLALFGCGICNRMFDSLSSTNKVRYCCTYTQYGRLRTTTISRFVIQANFFCVFQTNFFFGKTQQATESCLSDGSSQTRCVPSKSSYTENKIN